MELFLEAVEYSENSLRTSDKSTNSVSVVSESAPSAALKNRKKYFIKLTKTRVDKLDSAFDHVP